MEGNSNNNNDWSGILNLAALVVMMYIPIFLMSQGQFTLTSIYIILLSSWLIVVNRKVLKNNFNNFFYENKKLKKLDYYHIIDDNKTIDVEKRKEILGFIQNLSSGATLVLLFNFMSLYYLGKKMLGDSPVFIPLASFAMVLIILLAYGGIFVGIVYKYTTTTYVLLPGVGAIIYFGWIDEHIFFLPNFFRFSGYILIVLFLYLLLTVLSPPHILRKLNSRTILISSLLTVLAAFLNQILSFYFLTFFRSENLHLTLNSVKSETNISDSLKNIILENEEIIDLINHFIEKEILNQFTSFFSLGITAITISYILGGLVIKRRIGKNTLKAKCIYREMIKDNSTVSYNRLIQCSFYGGEEYEHLILNNYLMVDVILKEENNLDIPDVSKRNKFIRWYKNNSILYSTFREFHQVFKNM